MTVVHEALQEHQGEYDAVVSNPPFFIDSLAAPDEQRNMARHTATLTYGQPFTPRPINPCLGRGGAS